MQSRVPRLVPGIDVMSLPLSTTEGFVLSRVDGVASVEDISIMSGVAEDMLVRILARLADLGAVRLPWASEAGAGAYSGVTSASETEAVRYAPAELEEAGVEIPVAIRKRILDAYHALDGKDHYRLLGVLRTADRGQIRTAYFELARVFHPDSQFGKNLGGFKGKMEAVFRKLAEAYEVLRRQNKRAEYDDYLAVAERTREAHEALAEGQRVAEKVRRSQTPESSEPPAQASTPAKTATPSRPPETQAARKERMKQRLRQRLQSVSSQFPPPPRREPVSLPPAPSRAISERPPTDSSKTRDAAVRAARGHTERIAKHIAVANRAERKGDLLAAANEYQFALALDPMRGDLQLECERVSKLVASSLASDYEKQARYEEKSGNWEAAAESWTKVSDARPDDAAAARAAAEATLKAHGDLHRAQRYAQKAVRLCGTDVANLTVLARVYLDAGLRLNAQRELEKAAKLDPADEMVKNLLREAK